MYTDKVVVITGGSNGIGAALVDAYAERDAVVVNLDIAEGGATRGYFIQTDLADKAAIAAAFAGNPPPFWCGACVGQQRCYHHVQQASRGIDAGRVCQCRERQSGWGIYLCQ